MKKNLRGKIREFVQSEEGKVGVKSPLTLWVAFYLHKLSLEHQTPRHIFVWITTTVMMDISAIMLALVIQPNTTLRNGSDERILPSSSLIISDEY